MERNILEGVWVEIIDEEDFKSYFRDIRVQRGKYLGPGKYLKLYYEQPCPRGCCYDTVIELLSSEEAKKEVLESLEEHLFLLEPLFGGDLATKLLTHEDPEVRCLAASQIKVLEEF